MDALQKIVAPAPVARVAAADGAAYSLQRLVSLAVPGVPGFALEAMRRVPSQPVRFQAGHAVLSRQLAQAPEIGRRGAQRALDLKRAAKGLQRALEQMPFLALKAIHRRQTAPIGVQAFETGGVRGGA
ncbi:hypothetical protein D3C77_601570 [compost metagenome]